MSGHKIVQATTYLSLDQDDNNLCCSKAATKCEL